MRRRSYTTVYKLASEACRHQKCAFRSRCRSNGAFASQDGAHKEIV